MKRCPQCEFVYEDEQSLCDMDGSKLDFDSRPLPKLQVLGVTPAAATARSFWRGRIVPATASIVLGTVLALVYFVSTQRLPVRSQHAPSMQTGSTQPTALPVNVDEKVTPASPLEVKTEVSTPTTQANVPEPDVVRRDSKSTARREARATEAPKITATSKPNPAARKAPEPAPTPTVVNQKKESKVGDFLKKTSRLLKKPFKF